MTVEQEIQQLEDKKRKLLEQKKNDEKALMDAQNRMAVGKYFKACNNVGCNKTIGTSYITYIYVKSYAGSRDNESNFNVESFSITFSPAGWLLKDKTLSIQTGHNKVSVQVRRNFGSSTIEAGVDYRHNVLFTKGIKDGKIHGKYSNERYKECSKEEYFEALQFSIDEANAFSSKAKKFFSDDYYKAVTAESEGVFQMDYSVIQKYNSLIAHLTDKNVTLESLLHAAGKVRKYNYFQGTKLVELVQYSRQESLGINLDIQGGDDGTDYEPYTTHYYIEGVSLDWLTILYPIRTKLDSVQKTASDLYALKSVYLTSNWDCEYDTSTYDATFRQAKLKDSVLQQVNQIIEKHLK